MNKHSALSGQCAGVSGAQTGLINVIGTPNQWLAISVATGAPVEGMTFNPLLDNGTSNAALKLNNTGELDLTVSGDLILLNASGGTKNLSYTVTVDYQ